MSEVGTLRPDQVSVGVLVTAVLRDVIDPVVAGLGKRARRSDGKLAPHVTAYLTMGLWLFPDDPYEEVAAKVTGGLDRFGGWGAAWRVPSASGITQARKRLGSVVMREVFEGVAQPVATPITRGAWLGERRLVSVDGFDVDLPDSDENAAEFGYARGGRGESGYPKARVVALGECGTHAFLAAEIGAYGVGEDPDPAPVPAPAWRRDPDRRPQLPTPSKTGAWPPGRERCCYGGPRPVWTFRWCRSWTTAPT